MEAYLFVNMPACRERFQAMPAWSLKIHTKMFTLGNLDLRMLVRHFGRLCGKGEKNFIPFDISQVTCPQTELHFVNQP